MWNELDRKNFGAVDAQAALAAEGQRAFEVVEGLVTYAGSVQLLTLMEKLYGVYVPAEISVQVAYNYAYDVAPIRAEAPRLDTILIRNGPANQPLVGHDIARRPG